MKTELLIEVHQKRISPSGRGTSPSSCEPPHDPYLPPVPYHRRFLTTDKLTRAYDFLTLRNHALPTGTSADELRARYDEMVLYADAAIGDFIDWLDRTGRLDHAIVIVTADHGDSFEHHWFLHAGPPLYSSPDLDPVVDTSARPGTRLVCLAGYRTG